MRTAALLVLAALATGVAACEDRPATESSTAAVLPDVVGQAVGPQPGPDRPTVPVSNPFADDPSAPADGRIVFLWYNCEGCHGGRGGGGMGPSLRDITWLYGGEDQDIFNSISSGRAHGMPAWGTKLTTTQIWQLVSYIQSMDTEREPDQPPPNRSYPDPPPRD